MTVVFRLHSFHHVGFTRNFFLHRTGSRVICNEFHLFMEFLSPCSSPLNPFGGSVYSRTPGKLQALLKSEICAGREFCSLFQAFRQGDACSEHAGLRLGLAVPFSLPILYSLAQDHSAACRNTVPGVSWIQCRKKICFFMIFKNSSDSNLFWILEFNSRKFPDMPVYFPVFFLVKPVYLVREKKRANMLYVKAFRKMNGSS